MPIQIQRRQLKRMYCQRIQNRVLQRTNLPTKFSSGKILFTHFNITKSRKQWKYQLVSTLWSCMNYSKCSKWPLPQIKTHKPTLQASTVFAIVSGQLGSMLNSFYCFNWPFHVKFNHILTTLSLSFFYIFYTVNLLHTCTVRGDKHISLDRLIEQRLQCKKLWQFFST